MQAGILRHTIVIQKPTSTDDALGGQVQSWSKFAQVWAAINPVSGRDGEFAKTLAANVSHKIKIRWLAGVTPNFRILFGTREFSIQAALNIDERCREIDLYCTEKVT